MGTFPSGSPQNGSNYNWFWYEISAIINNINIIVYSVINFILLMEVRPDLVKMYVTILKMRTTN